MEQINISFLQLHRRGRPRELHGPQLRWRLPLPVLTADLTINPHTLQVVEKLTWEDVLPAAGVMVAAWLTSALAQWTIRQLAERAPARFRLLLLRLLPLSRLSIGLAAVCVIVPFFIEPQFHNIVAFTAS